MTFTMNVKCVEEIQTEGAPFKPATYDSSSFTGCDTNVTVQHASGCPAYSALGFVNFLNNNVWLSGTLMVFFGLFIGLFGQKYFEIIVGAVACLFAFVTVMILASIF
jgi:hypothetical protein